MCMWGGGGAIVALLGAMCQNLRGSSTENHVETKPYYSGPSGRDLNTGHAEYNDDARLTLPQNLMGNETFI